MASDYLSNNPNWEQKTLAKLVLETLKEQRRRRRWNVFFRILFYIFVFAILYLMWPDNTLTPAARTKNHTAVIKIDGVISSGSPANAESINQSLEDAFKDRTTKGIILSINSPGGSPVQASQIYNQIRFLQSKHQNVKVYAVCSDLCASAAYYIASAANDIYADPASLVGSIGVLLDSYGFVDAMHKVGVERRLFTSGSHKGFLDPFSPVKPAEQQYAQSLLDNVHNQFIARVVEGRGKRLKNDPNLFSGLVWTGSQALPLGLIDGYGDVHTVAHNIIRASDIVDYTIKPDIFDRLSGNFGASFAHSIATQLGSGSSNMREQLN